MWWTISAEEVVVVAKKKWNLFYYRDDHRKKEDSYFCEPEINELNRKGMDRSWCLVYHLLKRSLLVPRLLGTLLMVSNKCKY